ncbi:MAG: L,D-transpeptidase [Sphingobacteriales bacterium]|uniref:L,D-transpeptidase family protein n=1 Tax=Hydrotalea flava TaxID=714549 RepID=UPI00083326EC|nr:L,D-transpeptidase [Hydrotalea flava]RTL55649.1 MAG: L,D-transpeptidase [Sphingobacteriales bacterium]
MKFWQYLYPILFVSVLSFSSWSFIRPVANKDTYYVVIKKSDYSLTVYNRNHVWLAKYPVVFGSKDLGDKMVAGDRKTPEGIFHIVSKKIHPKWCRFLALDYPNAESYEKFKERKANGVISPHAAIGGGIGIHGTWPHEDFSVDDYQAWTEGCISTKNEYIIELYNLLPIGTKVIIEP